MTPGTVLVKNRPSLLEERRRVKMAESAHAYVRGNTIKFYEWLASSAAGEITPDGPPIWICGDCHVGNLGPVASAEGKVEIQIRDLDQTVVGNPAHDLIRLSLSLAMAARGSDLPGVVTALMIEEVITGYLQGLNGKAAAGAESDAEPIRVVMQQAVRRKWHHLAEERIKDVTPTIPLGKRFWVLSKSERAEIERIFAEEETRKLITSLKSRDDKDKITVVDAAYWVKGCSSLGRLRYAVLLRIGKGSTKEMCLVDIKESTRAGAPRAKDAEMPSNNAQRVVSGARSLSPFLGERMLAAEFEGRPVVLRELMPQDLKFEMEQLTQDEAIKTARLFGRVVGKAHGRQMNKASREAWSKKLKQNRLKTLHAPSWLWRCVVDLAASHEAAYLEHCRTYALSL